MEVAIVANILIKLWRFFIFLLFKILECISQMEEVGKWGIGKLDRHC